MEWLQYIAIFALAVACIGANFFDKKKERGKIAVMTPDEKEKYLEEKQLQLEKTKRRDKAANKDLMGRIQFGDINSAMICPHCQTKGKVRTKQITQKKGVSGGKATAAVLTGGLSTLAIGLSRKEASTQAHCDKCTNTWLF